ncbi:uncharacterized protein [Physcomitrium patens]|uniref:RING-CH-type domain-containing protein n=1 Tax=Physcomitrium patens TaxID=3218 RepID=A0A2K1K429_PHYPA|nr:uncharacterized protein LOC112287064 isoform X1 [Physcomitrium patens]PNR48530.1 hypothetical protein PHYPA_013007 [Physcomitrium patens]|eukprot:XP_024385463.1 uncharacterized protein LOC112287064 isoform X1 [Physcomitrella patens]
MLRRFNSLIKGPKALSSDEESTENLSLRPARSVDSSLFASKQRVAMASPLQQPVRRSEDGQTSLSVSVLIGSSQHEREERGRAFVIGQVPEDRSWKEGYEQGENSPATPQEQYEPGEKPSDFHCVDLSGSANDVNDSHDATMQTVGQSGENASAIQPQFTFLPVSTQLGNDQSQTELPRISRTSSDAVVAVDSNSQPNYHSTVDVSDVQHGSAVELENLLKGVLTFGPGRTISSWSTDSAAEYCRICQQHTEEPLIDLGCSCRGEMAKSHKSCIEVWFKNKGTNKCEVCQHVASNIPAPATAPVPHFWVWRLGGTNAAGQSQTSNGGIRRVGFQSSLIVNGPVLLVIMKKHPFIPVMWISLLAFMTYLFVDAFNTSTIGYAAMPIGFFFGVLVVLGLGTAVRLVLECCHERNVERSIQQMELSSTDAQAAPAQDADEPTVQDRPLPV